MNKRNTKKDNVIDFPNKLSSIEKEIEAIVFAAAEPLDIETIETVSYTHLTLPTTPYV